ncbi:MAG: deoxyhypusine synthase [Candidatus Binatota bacterium]|jgi:deoxyhypusine synthase|nr:deoxyhypusine synthase [Candidatus Binatota bacterium]
MGRVRVALPEAICEEGGGGYPPELAKPQRRHLAHPKIEPRAIVSGISVADLIDGTFLAYNGARLREACQLFARRVLADDVLVGMSVSGALTPAGLGMSALIPLIEAGFVDWMVSTGANLYHDTHFGIGLEMHAGSARIDDVALRRDGVVRIYDVLFEYDVLLETDAFYRKTLAAPEFQRTMSTAEMHHRIGRYVAERERVLGGRRRSLLAAAYEYDVPIYTSSPGDSSIGMNVAAMALAGNRLAIDASADVNETTAIVYEAKRAGLASAVVMLGGGSPKNFVLQTEPQIQEIMGMEEKGHDFYLQITDARPDTGGLSGATPQEAVSWGKVDPERLPDSVVCYADTTVALPLLTAYALAAKSPRQPKRLYRRREEMLARLRDEFARHPWYRRD